METTVTKNTGRRESDFYPTPQALCDAICQRLAALLPYPNRIIEPSAGSGNFIRSIRAAWPEASVTAVENDGNHEATLRALCADVVPGDFESCEEQFMWGDAPFLVVGNPPFSLAREHVEHALCLLPTDSHLAFLLRMSFLGSQERARTLWAKPSLRYLIPLAQRPSFTGGGTDNSEYAVFVWRKGFEGSAELLPHLWVR